MKHLFRRKNLFSLAILIAGICIANNVQAQTDVIYFDYNNNFTLSSCSNDYFYSENSDNLTVNSTGLATGVTINSISLDAHFGVTGRHNPTGNVEFYLNGNDIGGINGFQGSCNSGTINNIDPSFLVADGANTLSYTTSGDGTRRVWNATLTINYSVCTPPPAPDVPEDGVKLCLDATADALTATGDNLLWYTAPDDPTGSPDAPVPSTDNTGTTAYYVTQTVGCESDKAEIDVTVNSLPLAAVADFTNITCFGANDGTITVAASGGSGDGYLFSIDNGQNWSSSGTNTYQFTGLMPNKAYQIRVKDSNSCASPSLE